MVDPFDCVNRIILELDKIQKKYIWNNYQFFLHIHYKFRVVRFVRLRHTRAVRISNSIIFIVFLTFKLTSCSWLRLRFGQTNELLETILSDRGKMEKGSKEDAILLSPNFRNRSRSNDSWSFQRSLHGCQVFPVNHVPASRQGLGEKVRLVRQIR